MNEQQGKHLDERVRQALDKLPDDVPAPGSTFDAGKLWEQLRPELAAEVVVLTPQQPDQVQPAPTRRGWLVAASLAGLLIIWLWWSWQPVTDLTVVALKPLDTTSVGYVPTERVARPTIAVAAPIAFAKKPESTGNKLAVRKVAVPVNQPETLGEFTLAGQTIPEQAPTETLPIVAMPVSQSPVVVVKSYKLTSPKRRFQVVHVNELKAEDEAVYSQIRAKKSNNERFVRIGAGNQLPTRDEEQAPAISIPLNRKSPQ
ncbi:hypothetical protein [Fibrella aquatica]|uniref:hypothetical protein n=1 Tax=Fibrella aquatica TaxID=3242487 RepID=UPI00352212F2